MCRQRHPPPSAVARLRGGEAAMARAAKPRWPIQCHTLCRRAVVAKRLTDTNTAVCVTYTYMQTTTPTARAGTTHTALRSHSPGYPTATHSTLAPCTLHKCPHQDFREIKGKWRFRTVENPFFPRCAPNHGGHAAGSGPGRYLPKNT